MYLVYFFFLFEQILKVEEENKWSTKDYVIDQKKLIGFNASLNLKINGALAAVPAYLEFK